MNNNNDTQTETYHFNFIIEDMSQEVSDALLDMICGFADSHNLTLGGGVTIEESSDEE